MQGKQTFFALMLLGMSLLGISFVAYGYEATWQLWNIPTMTPHFADLRSITGGAESAALGFDPMYENPGDPWDRPMNYPRLWQNLFALGLNQRHTTLMGVLFIGLFVVGLLIFVGKIIDKIDRITAIYLALGLFSPAVLLGVERANNDLFIFFLLALAVTFAQPRPRLSATIATVAVFLKLFPLFGLFYLLDDDKRRNRTLFAISLVVIVLYFGMTYTDVVQIAHATQKGTTYSYGTKVYALYLANLLQRPHVASLIFIGTTIGVILLLFPLLTVAAAKMVGRIKTTPSLATFKLGAGIYVGTFLLGNNFDYRLVFLLFTIPQLVQWGKHEAPQVKWPARLTLGVVLLSWWSTFLLKPLWAIPWGDDLAFVLDEVANWLTFGGLFYLLLTVLPTWLWQLFLRLPLPFRMTGSLELVEQ